MFLGNKTFRKKQLIFKKRLSNTNAQRKWETLIKKGWKFILIKI